jgi:hypothetical protein
MGYSTVFSGGIAFNPPLTDKAARKIQKMIENIEPEKEYENYSCPWEIRICEGRWRIEWDQGEKPYYYEEWIMLVVRELDKRGYKMCGHIFWRGEEFTDNGIICVKDDGSNQLLIMQAQYGTETCNLRLILNGSNSWRYPYYQFEEKQMIADEEDEEDNEN